MGLLVNKDYIIAIDFGTSKITYALMIAEHKADGISLSLDAIGLVKLDYKTILHGCIENHEELKKKTRKVFDLLLQGIEPDITAAKHLNVSFRAEYNAEIYSITEIINGIASKELVDSKNIGLSTLANSSEIHLNTIKNIYYSMDNQIYQKLPKGKHTTEISFHNYNLFIKRKSWDEWLKIVTENEYFERMEHYYPSHAAALAILSPEELEQGAFVVDFGEGCTDLTICNSNGPIFNKTVKVGFQHIVNDISVLLDLPYNAVYDYLVNGELNESISKEKIKISNKVIVTKKLETIISDRISEIAEIISEELLNSKIPREIQILKLYLTGGPFEIKFIKQKFKQSLNDFPVEFRKIKQFDKLIVAEPDQEVFNDFRYVGVYGLLVNSIQEIIDAGPKPTMACKAWENLKNFFGNPNKELTDKE